TDRLLRDGEAVGQEEGENRCHRLEGAHRDGVDPDEPGRRLLAVAHHTPDCLARTPLPGTLRPLELYVVRFAQEAPGEADIDHTEGCGDQARCLAPPGVGGRTEHRAYGHAHVRRRGDPSEAASTLIGLARIRYV